MEEGRDDRKMANGVGKHKLLVIGPTEPWSVREKLCLATSVMKSGDQNWVSVSRAIKPFAEPGRPPDWFSQKHCASKYSELLETTEAPKRKRGERGEVVETVEDVIVRRLTSERIEELKKLIKETQEMHRKLKKEAELIQTGHLDSRLEELWEEIQLKQKMEEEEADLKRKNTDAAYQARQAARNAPKRIPSVSMHLPSACSSPSQEFPPGDQLEGLTLDLPSLKNTSGTVRSMTFFETSGACNDDVGHGAGLDDPTQKKPLSQKATPPPSPLLSELLKKGSILATNARLIGEVDGSTGTLTGAQDLQLTLCCQPQSQATGAPMLSRLLEAGPAQFSTPLGFMVGADSASGVSVSAATPVPADSTVSATTEGDVTAPSEHPECRPESTEEKVAQLSEEDVTVSYMGDELDLKTVGDIIAIIEDKADEAAEALDAAAVEAALSLCEENVHALSGSWDTGPFQPQEPHPTVAAVVAQSPPFHRSLDSRAEASLSSLYNSPDNSLAVFPVELRSFPITSSCHSKTSERRSSATPPQADAKRETGDPGKPVSTDGSKESERENKPQLKCEKNYRDSVLEDHPQTDWQPEETKGEDGVGTGEGEDSSETKADSEVIEPEVCEEDEGDGVEEFFSEPDGEMELEPAASESEDGYSLHTASSSLQLHTTADSIPSSPTSSQFSMCSEDLEALQAHKIWKKAIMLVWRAAANHRYANVFLQPVTDEIAPGYHSIVHRPMDLATIKKNIEMSLIRTTAEFQRDIMLMFQNAVMYNSLDHDVYHMALEMQRDVLEQIQQFLATQLIMETSESGISAKSLRGRESTRRQDSTDKDGGTRGRRSAIEADLKMKK
ncbi:bromodomain-containing protein 8 isoform X2 [Austrofundulus limnaeus]|uniref:Bromodomain-containing protein 8 n=1 Tax=Austrofundulus limnaeus TaxID=52670 RepID=A0A2I4D2T6_AUSLI|nr:PREDICTED: bromodomain-containing protein 8-like isoform X2 [Austrofundulus limnaeus]